MYDANDGWVHNVDPTGGDLGGQSTEAVRGHLQYRPNDSMEVLATAYVTWKEESWGPYLVFATRPVLDAHGNVINTVLVNAPTGIGTTSSNARDLTVDANDAQSTGNWNHVAGGTLKAT